MFCSGKIYYDLVARRAEVGSQRDVAIVRVEQLYPWPADELKTVLERYRSAREWVWVQEESQNMGAWTFVAPRLQELLGTPVAVRRPRRQRQPGHRLEARPRPRAGRDRRGRRRRPGAAPGHRLGKQWSVVSETCVRASPSSTALPPHGAAATDCQATDH